MVVISVTTWNTLSVTVRASRAQEAWSTRFSTISPEAVTVIRV